MSSPDPTTAHAGTFLEQVATARVIPVVRTTDAREAVDVSDRLLAAGLTMVELTATTPGWPEALRRVRARHPDRLVGLGTVRHRDDALLAVDAGADFLVSPCPAPDVRAALAGHVPFIEGGLSVGEVLASAEHGVAKLFPAHVGGTSYLRSLLAVAPQAKIVPTGGIALGDVPAWLSAGALAVGVGRDLIASQDIVASVRTLLDATVQSG